MAAASKNTVKKRNQFMLAICLVLLSVIGIMNPIFELATFLSLITVIAGHIALIKNKSSAYAQKMIYFAIVLGYLGIAIFLYYSFMHEDEKGYRNKAKKNHNITALHNIYLACRLYANDNEGMLPDGLDKLTAKGYLDRKYTKNYFIPENEYGFKIIAEGTLAKKKHDEILAIEIILNQDKPLSIISCDGRILEMKIITTAPQTDQNVKRP